MVRWDSPLFTVFPTDELPLDTIWLAITTGHKAAPHAAVVQNPRPPVNTLQILSTTTSAINSGILAQLSRVPGATDYLYTDGGNQRVRLPGRVITLGELQRLKRQYEGTGIKAQTSGGRAAGGWGKVTVARGYARFLEQHWGLDD